MTESKFTQSPSGNELVDKINGVIDDLGNKVDTTSLATVATTGDYDDLLNKPTIPAAVTVDQTYDGTSANPQSGVAIEGQSFIKNKATGSYSLSILGLAATSGNSINIGNATRAEGTNVVTIGYGAGYSSSSNGSVSIGYQAKSASNAISIGYQAEAPNNSCICIGDNATTTGTYSIQLGYGTNPDNSSFYVGFKASPVANSTNWKLLDGLTGLIPDTRLPVGSDSNKGIVQVDDDTIGATNGTIAVKNLTPIHAVVETYVNGASWYRVYDDGWCEQGGVGTSTSDSGVSIVFLKEFADTNYAVSITVIDNGSSNYSTAAKVRTTSDMKIVCYTETKTMSWQAYGYISQA